MRWKIVERLFSVLLLTTSPEFRGIMESFIIELYQKAKKTDSPLDDFFVKFMAGLLLVKLED